MVVIGGLSFDGWGSWKGRQVSVIKGRFLLNNFARTIIFDFNEYFLMNFKFHPRKLTKLSEYGCPVCNALIERTSFDKLTF